MPWSTIITALPAFFGALTLPGFATAHTDTDLFARSAFVEAPEVVDCTLEDGRPSHCNRITVGYLPTGLAIGPFCPATLDEAASGRGGIWDWDGREAGLYRIDRAFLEMLNGLGYRFYDDGTVHVVDNATERPTVDHACITVSADKSVRITMLLPVDPVMADAPTSLGTVAKVGVALDGVPIFADAPSVLVTGHMPALDTCGGHIDPGGWYHWHATATDIDTTFRTAHVAAECALAQDAGAMFGYAFDGFPMFGSTEEDGSVPADLDACHGHVGPTAQGQTYHYHAASTFPNLPPCLVGVTARDNFSTTATAGVGATRAGTDGRNEPPRPGDGAPGQTPPGFDAAAKALGVTTDALMSALGDPRGDRPDLPSVARTLGIDESALRAALPAPNPRP